ncbi:nucleoside triphosphate pyrophosphohydrolase family protein [Lacticaseibacillus songhuajiangensis]|jgi:NTP pyrophosphatase (non-canonical NTP hydrolase)|uniref:nucleoside triphosphate pyrophosphohydrolase family protein n=1 Tax=Lacticaseibacillus songhuajiangensis TaxID=1296539 RepID=UPI000F76DB22|nr:nucleoside triphosphate pyrophosphohydrolase family protein [Lacticaseibacillus songhuajiangensis]MCI1283073.1 nucleoside triphosphate pyrophosphohydrolase family protein [Lacticaseibacillus songhuajiangensis]
MEFNDYQKLANRTLEGNEHVLTNLSLGLASESGEVIDLIKKYTFQGADLDQEQLKHEMGDVLWYLSQIALWANVDFDEVAKSNIKSLEQKYPNVKR